MFITDIRRRCSSWAVSSVLLIPVRRRVGIFCFLLNLRSLDHRRHALEQAALCRTDGETGRDEEVSAHRIGSGAQLTKLRARERFAWGKSDILLNLRAYDATRDLRNASLRSFCEEVRLRHYPWPLLTPHAQNFINPSTIRDINSLRQDFLGSLTELGYMTDRAALNVNSDNEHLLKGILTGAFYPRVAMIRPPDARFEKIQAGALVKEHEAKEVKFYDESGRVFIVCPSRCSMLYKC